ncbi:MAG: hypothetical protein QW273_03190 [Candidatus Pacearchaeota archaeon]
MCCEEIRIGRNNYLILEEKDPRQVISFVKNNLVFAFVEKENSPFSFKKRGLINIDSFEKSLLSEFISKFDYKNLEIFATFIPYFLEDSFLFSPLFKDISNFLKKKNLEINDFDNVYQSLLHSSKPIVFYKKVLLTPSEIISFGYDKRKNLLYEIKFGKKD